MKVRILTLAASCTVAMALSYTLIPFLPTTMLIQPVSLAVNNDGSDVALFTRTVSFPIEGDIVKEIVAENTPLPDCNLDATVWFEDRGLEPLTLSLDCGLVDGVRHTLRLCISAAGPWGLHFKPACISTTFLYGVPPEQRVLEGRIIELESQVQGIERMVSP